MTELVLKIIAAIIGLPTAIFLLIKAYLELKKAIISRRNNGTGNGEGNMDNSLENSGKITNAIVGSKVEGDITTHEDSHDTTVCGDINYYLDSSRQTREEYPDGENIILKEEYTTLFAENGAIHSERISIRNVGNGRIEGDVFLDNENTYKLYGTFKNRILTGEFISVGRYKDERGTINLKLISEDILSGFCSFSKISSSLDDQIRVSPYVWVAGSDNEDLLNGTYKFCTQCHKERKKCCCESEDIDLPVVLYSEALKYQSSNPKNQRMRDFSRPIGGSQVRQMKYANGSTKCCHFYNSQDNKCRVYEMRPTDCRLFPFDIKVSESTGEYWVGYYDEVCERSLPDRDIMKIYAHILRPQLFLLFPYAEIINCDEVCQRLKKTHFERLYKLHDFIF